jgi:hypothetical protein
MACSTHIIININVNLPLSHLLGTASSKPGSKESVLIPSLRRRFFMDSQLCRSISPRRSHTVSDAVAGVITTIRVHQTANASTFDSRSLIRTY